MLYASVDLHNASVSWNSASPPPSPPRPPRLGGELNIGSVLKHR